METDIRMSEKHKKAQFKSYYVVWKQYIKHFVDENKYSLNRTMQYGNCSNVCKDNYSLSGLNRTMQYGNSIKIIKK